MLLCYLRRCNFYQFVFLIASFTGLSFTIMTARTVKLLKHFYHSTWYHRCFLTKLYFRGTNTTSRSYWYFKMYLKGLKLLRLSCYFKVFQRYFIKYNVYWYLDIHLMNLHWSNKNYWSKYFNNYFLDRYYIDFSWLYVLVKIDSSSFTYAKIAILSLI